MCEEFKDRKRSKDLSSACFSLWGLVLARTKIHRLKPAPPNIKPHENLLADASLPETAPADASQGRPCCARAPRRCALRLPCRRRSACKGSSASAHRELSLAAFRCGRRDARGIPRP